MRAICIHWQHLQRILDGSKTNEYRSYRAKPGPMILCSTAATDRRKQGHCYCVVDILDVVPDDRGEEGFAWKLSKPRLIEQRPIKGLQAIFSLPDDYATPLESALPGNAQEIAQPLPEARPKKPPIERPRTPEPTYTEPLIDQRAAELANQASASALSIAEQRADLDRRLAQIKARLVKASERGLSGASSANFRTILRYADL